MEQRSTVGLEEEEEEIESSQSPNTSTDKIESQVTTSNEEVVSESTSPVENISSESTTVDETIVSESTSVDEKSAPESTSAAEEAVSDEKALSGTAPQEEEDEEEECGFCLFMKKGPCGERFKLWQDCVEGAEKSEKDIVEQCAQTTTLLKVCMEMNTQYYGPILDAEKAIEADLASTEETGRYGGKPSEPPAGGEEGADSGHGEQTIETTDVLVELVDDEGQTGGEEGADSGNEEQTIETTEVVDDEGRTGGGEGADSGNGEQTIETTEVFAEVVDDEGQVVEAVDVVEVQVRAI